MPAPWGQRLLCNEGLVQGHCLALMRDAAPLGNGTECFFSLRVSNLKAACPLCKGAPPAVLGLLGPQHPWVLLLAGDLASSSLLQEWRHLTAQHVWSNSSKQQSQGIAPAWLP